MQEEDRFWSHVEIKSDKECWEWKIRKDRWGYGCFKIGKKYFGAHRMAWKYTYGEIPKTKTRTSHGICVLHRCDNPSCCNPWHLVLGTNDDNVRDRDRKGRQAKGKIHGMKSQPNKYSKEDIERAILEMQSRNQF